METQYQNFAKQLIACLEEFEKVTGKRIIKSGYGYRVEDNLANKG
jgi:hypothetical protein